MKVIPEGLGGIRYHEGYLGGFTTEQGDGAWANGSRVVKVSEDKPGEGTPLGTHGTVLGSLVEKEASPYPMYFIEWDDKPKIAVSCIGYKLELVQ